MCMSRKDDLSTRRELRQRAAALGSGVSLEESGCLALIDASLTSVRESSATAEKVLPLHLLSDLVDHIPLPLCPVLVNYMDTNESALKKCLDVNPTRLMLVQLCKRLTCRHCSTTDTLLCGRVMRLTSRLLGMSERSGLNLQGEVSIPETALQTEEDMDVVSVDGEAPVEVSSPTVGFDFYKRFWGFQRYFTDPNSVLDHVTEFSSDLECILAEFDSSQYSSDTEASCATAEDAISESFTLPKYLTARKPLPLQLRDSSFRRCVLVQALVLLESLHHRAPSSLVGKPAAPAPPLDVIQSLEEKVLACLRRIPPKGDEVAQSVQQVLAKEQLWVTWKAEKCPSINKVKSSSSELLSRFLAQPKAEESASVHRLGNADLSRLWDEHAGSSEELCSLVRPHLSPAEFLQEYRDQVAPDSGVEKQYFLSQNRLYVWRALRVIARQSMHAYCKSLGSSTTPEGTPLGEQFERLFQDVEEEARIAREEEKSVAVKPQPPSSLPSAISDEAREQILKERLRILQEVSSSSSEIEGPEKHNTSTTDTVDEPSAKKPKLECPQP